MEEDTLKKEMQKPIGAAITPIEWFLIFSFIDHAMKQDNMFSSEEDREALSNTVKRIHDQVFPPKKDNLSQLEDMLGIKPKKLITSDTEIIV